MFSSFFEKNRKKKVAKKETCYFSSLGCKNPVSFEVIFQNGDNPKKHKICEHHKNLYDKFRNGRAPNLRNWNEFILHIAKLPPNTSGA